MQSKPLINNVSTNIQKSHKKNKMTKWKYFKKNRELFILSLPGVIYTFIFAYLPLLFLVVAFKRFRFDLGILGSPWVGLDNFKFFFTSQAAAIITRNTVLYNLTFIVLTTVISVTLAILLNEMTSKWQKIHQTLLFLPYFLSWVVVGYITQAFLDSKSGLINQLFETYGFSPVNWYQEAKYWPFIIILVHLWKHIGFATLVYYGGLMGIDSTYYEAAKIDGASKWQMIKKITIPLLMPLIIILFIVDMGKIFRAEFGLFYFVPNDVSFLYSSTDVIDTYVYRSLRVVGDLGMATAVGLYQSIIGLILVVSTNYIIRKINKDHALW
jgi:putative aldouronate transport system permease protein